MTVIPQLYEDTELIEGSGGLEFTQRFDVQDIPTTLSFAAAMYAALTAVDAVDPSKRVPHRFDPSPDIPGLFVVDKRVRPWAPADAAVFVKWGVLSLSIPQSEDVIRIEGGASLREQQTQKDRDGNPLTVDFMPQGGQWQGAQSGSVSQFFAYPQLRFTRKEQNSPEPKILNVGKRNAAGWRGFAAKTWIFADLPFRGIVGQQGFETTYVFVSDPYDKFEPIIRWIDPLTGRPPKITDVKAALDSGNGLKKADKQYFDFDFNTFGF